MNIKKMIILIIAAMLLLCSCKNTKTNSSSAGNSGEFGAGKINGNVMKVDSTTVRYIGRAYLDTSDIEMYFKNNYSGIEFSFKGTSLDANVRATAYSESGGPYIKVYIDNMEPKIFEVSTLGYINLAKDLEDKEHNVRIVKITEANSGAISITELKISEGGKFLKPFDLPTDRKMVIIGDSITCGFGNVYDPNDPKRDDKHPAGAEDGSLVYSVMASQMFQAEPQVVAISGIGIARNAGGKEPHSGGALSMFNDSTYDFSTFTPHVVVIALGTNDAGAEDDELRTDAIKFVETVREKYPDAQIIWSYGLMGNSKEEVIKSVIEKFNSEGDNKISYLHHEMPTGDEGIGLYGHPSLATHERAANELADKITEVTGWTR